MKNIIFLYAGFSLNHAFDILFSGKSAFERVYEWALGIKDCSRIVVGCNVETENRVRDVLTRYPSENASIVTLQKWNTASLLSQMATIADSEHADYVVYTSADKPFLDKSLTEQVIGSHVDYLAEYTFADGYPCGLSPEVINSGTLNIMLSLASGKAKSAGDSLVTNDSLFNVLKVDINAFEIETVISPKDYRMLRLDFSCSTKGNTLACKALYDKALGSNLEFSAISLSDAAAESAAVQHTVPSFYNVQIAENCSSRAVYNPYVRAFKEKNGYFPVCEENDKPGNMSLEKFRCIVNDIAEFSETAVVDISGFADPLTHPDVVEFVREVLSKKGLSVLIETDGTLVSVPLAKEIFEISRQAGERMNGFSPVMWIVNVDAVTEKKYNEIHQKEGFKAVLESIKILQEYFPDCVYPQMLRMNSNEEELEPFYRYYHDKESPSKGNLIIQKYDHYCGYLKEEKPADLTPVKRGPCWHIKRDLFVLPDGNVPLCREYILDNSIGNVFSEGIEKIWGKTVSLVEEHIHDNYGEKCGCCDEYYTFNF